MTNTRRRMAAQVLVAGLAAALLVVTPLAGPAAATAPTKDHADALDVFERDIYVIVGSTLRTPDSGTDPDETLFNDAGARLESAPGDALTWGEWSAVSARSDVVVHRTRSGATTQARVKLSGLVPDGLYSMFWGTLGPDSEQPLCPGVERTLPLDAVGAMGGGAAPNSFRADGRGKAVFVGQVNQDLFAASQVFFSIVWHFSGETHYPFPNQGEALTQVPAPQCRSSFGQDAMRHLLILQKW